GRLSRLRHAAEVPAHAGRRAQRAAAARRRHARGPRRGRLPGGGDRGADRRGHRHRCRRQGGRLMADASGHDPPLDRREGYKTWASDKLRFADTDLLGHVNNAAFATFCETGRVMFLYDPEREIKPPGTDFVIARLVLDFRRELHYPGLVEIGTRVLRVGGSSFVMGQGLFKDGNCVATSWSTCVLIERATRKSVRLPDELRQKLTSM